MVVIVCYKKYPSSISNTFILVEKPLSYPNESEQSHFALHF